VSVVAYHERIRERVVEVRSRRSTPVTVELRDAVSEYEWEDDVSADASNLPEGCTFDPNDGVTCSLDLAGDESRVVEYEASRELRRGVPEAEVAGEHAPGVDVLSAGRLARAADELCTHVASRRSDPAVALADACEAAEGEQFVDALRRVRDAQLASKPDVDSLLSAARQDADAAASAFDEDDYDTAIERWQDAREKYERVSYQLVTREESDLEAKVERSLERVASNVADCKLARGAAKVDAAEELVGERSKRASSKFEDALDYLGALDVDREAQIDALETRARKGRLRSLIDVGRSRMETAERQYDASRLDEAKATFRDAKEFFRNVSDLAIEYDQSEFRREAGSLVDTCVENVEQINTELTRVEGVSPVIERVEEVPSQGHERPEAAPPVDDGRREDEFDRERFVRRTDRNDVGARPPAHERLDQIGEGGQARVFRVRLEESGTVAALKVAKYRGTVDRGHVRRFLDSAEQWSLVDDHEHVVSVYDWGFGSDLWLLQEYVAGGDLTERTGRVSVERATEILAGIADALQYARGVDHLDVKPANVLVDDDGTAKLADWGLARVAFDHEYTNTRLGLSPPYAAPEQIDRTLGRRDNLTDIYQLGVTGYELLTGVLPFDPEAGPSLEQRILEVEPEPPSHHDPSIPAALDEVILTAMAKDREDRYEAALEFRNALEDVSDGA
jgi:serine/threonine-protein kinase